MTWTAAELKALRVKTDNALKEARDLAKERRSSGWMETRQAKLRVETLEILDALVRKEERL